MGASKSTRGRGRGGGGRARADRGGEGDLGRGSGGRGAGGRGGLELDKVGGEKSCATVESTSPPFFSWWDFDLFLWLVGE